MNEKRPMTAYLLNEAKAAGEYKLCLINFVTVFLIQHTISVKEEAVHSRKSRCANKDKAVSPNVLTADA